MLHYHVKKAVIIYDIIIIGERIVMIFAEETIKIWIFIRKR